MANEFQHKDPGATMTQAEYITTDGTGHIFDSQSQGDILYASSSTVLSRLPKSGTTTHALLNSGTSNNPAWAQIPLASAVTGTLPVANGGTGITSLGSNVATFLGTPSSANLRSALTDETGSGSAVFATSPTLVTPALGTPASGVMTNVSGTASSLTAGNVTTNANLTGVVTSSGNATAIADKAIGIAKLADGTDGELITWNASGVIAAVAAGNADQVLTSNGAGAAPTFQAAASGPTEATKANMEDEATGTIYVPPDLVKNSPGVAKVWINIHGTDTFAVEQSYNCDGATDEGTGTYEVTVTTDFAGANNNIIVCGGQDGVVSDPRFNVGVTGTNLAAGVFRLISMREDGTTGVSALADGTDVMGAVFGAQ
jgi:hypothetical protein